MHRRGRRSGSAKVSDFADGKPVTIGADDSVEEALRTMAEHGVRRLPVIDGHQLDEVVSHADVAKNLPEDPSVIWSRPSPQHRRAAEHTASSRRPTEVFAGACCCSNQTNSRGLDATKQARPASR
jgi:CBS-domain-containing membrane protein